MCLYCTVLQSASVGLIHRVAGRPSENSALVTGKRSRHAYEQLKGHGCAHVELSVGSVGCSKLKIVAGFTATDWSTLVESIMNAPFHTANDTDATIDFFSCNLSTQQVPLLVKCEPPADL